ncbi:MAG: hypothetical protein C0197_04185 [Caldimicrobium thiodismutans]|uniref:Uncharacterized protein n=1 Tax=Caldimicrobium thiodismutans TaxID=1653476 RepID=A0A2N7PJE6_9BACT|nr:MAG: hypothetical protein C0197_04185 [Caldimicrobium thiodismutans]
MDQRKEIENAFKNNPFFCHYEDKYMRMLCGITTVKSFKKGKTIIKKGEKAMGLYIDKFLDQSKDIITSWLKDVEKELIFEINRVYSTLFTSDIKIEQSLLNLGSSSNKT